ncbi:unnamed protein product [Arabidopsis lyrata]|uniref:mitogen-activated protein kinase kinase 9 n=1 Tax=Arabidopsis lyrata subsp. lyrata TaxID=81972 RepID=UPI000A29E788|nr:mitogen-activated protein kinase kinase 9 [Arabidopsis lyrata subsp. lyrata]CAH8267555.1 unnamed protein product [Arabidopsis lyrata]|eukprot:XP_020882010.1 mitogen-activated protein kinase kinase 9 [Arabidopsis lyrata subsp. lyrata]
MDIESEISMSSYFKRYGQVKFNEFSNTPLKKPKYSPTTSVIEISDSSSSNNSMIPPLPQNPIFTVKLSPIMLHLRRCSRKIKKKKLTQPLLKKKKKKKSISSSVKFLSRGSFNAAVQKRSTTVTRNGGVRKVSSWVKSRLLGEGGYASVYLATSKDDRYKTERAIKSAELSKASSLMHEGRILKRLQSPFVISCYGDEIAREGTGHEYNLVLEYCAGQCLVDLIEDNHGGLSEFDVKQFSRDVLSGLSYIHSRNIVHCDIKPDNLLLSPVDHRFRFNGYLIKIADFGLSMEKGSVEYGNGCGHMRGTTRYMAPELIGHGVVDFGVDIWAFGCSVLEMLTGQMVWGEHGDLVFDDWVKLIGHTDLIPRISSRLSEEAQDFLRRCFVKEPGSRWRINELMNHPFLYSDVDFSHNGFVYD